MRIMTFNVLCAGRNEHQWCRRQPLVRDVIKKYMPDFFGVYDDLKVKEGMDLKSQNLHSRLSHIL